MRRPRSNWKLLREIREMKGVVHLLAPYSHGHGGRMAGGIVLTVLLLGFRLLQPWPLKWILDGLTGVGTQPVSPEWSAAGFLAVTGMAAAAEYGQVMVLVGLGNQVLYRFRTHLFRHVLQQSLAFHERKAQGELLTRVVYDTTRLRKGVNQVLTRFFQTLLTFVATVGVLFWVDPFLASVMGVLGAMALAIMAKSSRKVKRAAKKNRRREGKLAALVAEELLAIRDVQTFRPDASESDAFARVNAKSLKQEGKIRRLGSLMLFRVEVVMSIGVALVLLLGSRRVASGDITAGELVLFVSYATALYTPFFRFARQSTRMGTTLASAHRLQKLMSRAPEIVDLPGAVEVERLSGAVEFRSVSVLNSRSAQGSRRWALRKVAFSTPGGESVAVVGANGAGKSTILRTLLRLTEPKKGEILIDGHPLPHFTRSSLRGRMSVVFQEGVLFGLSVRENLILGRPGATDEEILETLARVGARDMVERLPDGLDTVVQKAGKLLSAGERQRLTIARALLTDGDVWLVDEPTTGLDVGGADAVIAILREVTRGKTSFWVTHDPRLAAQLDRILLLHEGEVAFFGTRDEFQASVSDDPMRIPEPIRSSIEVTRS
ncbi:MAG: ABC transporter ATP-binding protein/permease [Gemmatimonadota bacterium]|nr:ABC transporter ATP-binding protein/permease [Gemmatimonadota bacterium]